MIVHKNKRKILALYVYDNQHELVETTTNLLMARGLNIDAICVSTFRYVKGTNISWPWIVFIASFFVNKLRLPKAQGFFHKLLNDRIYKRLIDQYDIVDFQSFPSSQVKLAEYCIEKGKEYLIHFWGSDILRADNNAIERMKKPLDHCKYIRLNNKMRQKLSNFYPEQSIDYEQKYTGAVDGIICGNKDIFLLDSLTEKDIAISAPLFRDNDSNKLLITIGYNGNSKQNQDRIVNVLAQLSDGIKQRIHLVLPMTYGTSPEQLKHVKTIALESGISFTILDKFLSNKEVCVLRTITNVFIMMQDTDAFAGSVRSHVYCQNVCLIGDWLDYPMEKEEMFYLKVNWDNLYEKLVDVILHFEEYHEKSLPNKKKMLPFMTWDRYIDFMCKLYK